MSVQPSVKLLELQQDRIDQLNKIWTKNSLYTDSSLMGKGKSHDSTIFMDSGLPGTGKTQDAMPIHQSIKLLDTQVDHFNRVDSILTKFAGYIDTSVTGAGKSYIVAAIAKKHNFTLLVVCPVSVIDVWKNVCNTYDVPLYNCISYQSLRSIRGCQPTHGLLSRFDTQKDVEFVPTDTLKALVTNGILVVFDECQNIKNNSDQTKACSAICKLIIDIGYKARFALLSASPFDKEEHTINVCKLLGLITYQKMWQIHQTTKEIIPLGIRELIELCQIYDAEKTQELLIETPVTKNNIKHLAFKLFSIIIMKRIGSSMPPPKIPFKKDCANGYYNIDKNTLGQINKGVNNLANAVSYNDETGTIDRTGEKYLSAVTKALTEIELAKVPIFIRLAKEQLLSNPKCKVIICMNYLDSIKRVFKALQEFEPMMLIGDVKQKDRGVIVNSFQDRLSLNRLLICNTSVAGIGISLHDTVGDAPRFMFISPNYSIINLHQATGRIYRVGTLSDATVRFVFGNGANRETKILDALARKKVVLHELVDRDDDEPILLPGEYPSYIEN